MVSWEAALSVLRQLSSPRPKMPVGLNSVTNNTKQGPIQRRTCLTMLILHGLDSAIMDPTDKEMMAAEVLLNKKLYADDFLKG